MKKFTLKSIIPVFASVMIFQLTPCAYAHTTSHDGILAKTSIDRENYPGLYIGGDDVGWRINERYHTNGYHIFYSFSGSFTNSTYKQYVREGAALWKDIITISEPTLFNKVTGTIESYNDPSDRSVAKVNNRVTDSNGHLTSWTMKVNLAHSESLSPKVFAHEFGHVIGLTDLYSDNSKDKIMYGYVNSTVNAPTESDKNGAKVIIGFHDTHYWGYKPYSTQQHVKSCVICGGFCAGSDGRSPIISNCTFGYKYHSTSGQGVNFHVKCCTVCEKTTTVSSCSYNAKGICTYCGTPKGTSPYSLGFESE